MAAAVRPVPTVPSELKTFLRSVLVSSNGVRESRVERDYRELAGERLEWRKLGFKSLREFLCAIPDVCRLQYSTKEKENRVYAVEVKGIYMSSHARKNVKSASNVQLPQNNTNMAPLLSLSPPGRRVQQDGDSLKITVDERAGNGLLPNKSGFYQVYVARLPPNSTKGDLKMLFLQYGDVKEVDIVTSSRNKKIGFVRYALKQEALRALTEGKTTPPVMKGQALDVGEAKCKNINDVESCVNTVLNCEPKNGSNMLPPISTQISTPSSPTAAFQWPIPSALSVFKNDVQDKHFSTGDSMTDSSETLNEPLFAVNVSGYINQKMKETDLRKILQNIGHIEQFEYHPLYSIVKFKTRNEAMNALQNVNGKLVNGSVLLITALSWPVEESTAKSKTDEVKRNDKIEAKTKLEVRKNEVKKDEVIKDEMKMDEMKMDEMKMDEMKMDEVEKVEDQISEIYKLYSEAIVSCWDQSYQKWLDALPLVFEIKVMEVIDPCTFWAHLFDGTTTYEHFNDLTNRLRFIDPLSNKKLLGKNEFGIGQFSEDGEWYRCYCYEVSSNGKHLHVMYIDYGNCEWLEQDKVVPLPPSFLQLQPQGVLVKLSGFRWQSDKKSVNSPTLLCAKQLLMGSGQAFKARKASVDPSKPLLLEAEILQSEGEAIYKKLSCQPGIEVTPRPASPVQHLLLSSPPLLPDNFQPLKKGLVAVKSGTLYIWITNITSQTTFYFQLVNTESKDAIRAIQEYLSQCDIQNKINIRNIKGESLVCHHRNGRERSRVQLLSASRYIVPGQVNVLHVDIGKEAMVPCTSFISLPLGANAFPYQARPARLFNVPNHLQSSAALDFIIQQSNKVLRAKLISENRDESVVVELFDFKGESINKQMLEIISNEHATHAQSHNPGVNALSNKSPSVTHGTVQSDITNKPPLMKVRTIPPQDTLTVDTSFTTSHEPTDIVGAQGNRDGFENVSPAEKPFGKITGKDVFPRPNLASNQNQVSPQSAWNLGPSGQNQPSPTSPLKLEPNGQNQVGPMSPSRLGSSSRNQVDPMSPSKFGPRGQNQVSRQSGWKLGPLSQNQGPPSLSELAPSGQKQVSPSSPSRLGPNGQNQVGPWSPSKVGPSGPNQVNPTSLSKLEPSSQNQIGPWSTSKLGPNTQNQVSSTFPSKLGPSSQSQSSPPLSKAGVSSQSQASPPLSKAGISSQSQASPPLSKAGVSSQSQASPPLSKAGVSSQSQASPPLSKAGVSSQSQASPPLSKAGVSSQSQASPSLSKAGVSSQSQASPPLSKAGVSSQSQVSPPSLSKVEPIIENQVGKTLPSKPGPFGKSSPSPFVGESKTNNVSSQVNSGPKKAEPVSKTLTGNAKASQSNLQNQTSPFTLKQESVSQSSSLTCAKPSRNNPPNDASPFLLKQGTLETHTVATSSPNSTTKASTVLNRAEGSKGFVKSKQKNTKNSKPSHDEKPANEKQVPKDLKPVKHLTSGGRKFSPPIPTNAQKSVDGSAKGGRGYNDRALAKKVIGNYDELKKKIEEQERILSRPASEQRRQLVQQKIKEKLEVQVRIKKLENAVFSLQNEIQKLNLEKDNLEKQLDDPLDEK